tara:strand:- start:341 stop:523 length:183 start_codon:yes stop_codon:yes gene_type:complete
MSASSELSVSDANVADLVNLLPISTAERNNLPLVQGTLVYNQDSNLLQYYNGSSWQDINM